MSDWWAIAFNFEVEKRRVLDVSDGEMLVVRETSRRDEDSMTCCNDTSYFIWMLTLQASSSTRHGGYRSGDLADKAISVGGLGKHSDA